jgi:hypothetical protein
MEILATPKEIIDLGNTDYQSVSDDKSFKDQLCAFCKVDLTKVEGIDPKRL